ncbi:hypothetical protein JW921_00085, partial [Candidatus Fermentibacterales bacterium]|nr:hypothetical protein [Candidatus Fermentibacterales bacterium]
MSYESSRTRFDYCPVENGAALEEYGRLMEQTGRLASGIDGSSSAYAALVLHCSRFLLRLDDDVWRKVPGGYDPHASLNALLASNLELFPGLRGEGAYESSFANPVYCARLFGLDRGRRLAFLASSLTGARAAAVRGLAFLLPRFHALVSRMWHERSRVAPDGAPDLESLDGIVRAFEDFDRTAEYTAMNRQSFDPGARLLMDVLEGSDLEDPRYLFDLGCLVTGNEIETSKFLAALGGPETERLAESVASAYVRGFEAEGKDMSG